VLTYGELEDRSRRLAGLAPCPPAVKEAMLDWLGPIVHEYHPGSEGAGFCAIGPDEWRAHRGSVGRSLMGTVHIVGPDGQDLPPGETGQVWFDSGASFEYHNDPAKTAEAIDARGWATIGDIDHLDADGYLYLSGRVALGRDRGVHAPGRGARGDGAAPST
jgi:long-chain acyl-CoA synthetase